MGGFFVSRALFVWVVVLVCGIFLSLFGCFYGSFVWSFVCFHVFILFGCLLVVLCVFLVFISLRAIL